MHAAADRPEFAPPPQPGLLRAFVLAVVAHLLLVLALTQGLHWKRESQDAAVEAELWSALPQQAAPRVEPVPVPVPAPPPPPPPPVVKPAPQPEPPAKSQADIALEHEKEKRLLEQKHLAEQKRLAELEKQRERAKAEALKKHEEELARKKEQQQKLLAEAKKKEEEKKRKEQEQETRLAKQREQLREDTLKRMQGMAGTGGKDSQGAAQHASGPSASWAGRVQARVRPNIVFPDNIGGNPQAIVEVRLGPGGMILGKPRLVKPSGVPTWDEAVIRALEKTETLPPDTDGRYPSPVEISFKPKA